MTHPAANGERFLAIAGEFDSVCPFSDAQWMAEHARQGTAVELPGVAHIAPAENPAAGCCSGRLKIQSGSGGEARTGAGI